jgi:hypothetical protein
MLMPTLPIPYFALSHALARVLQAGSRGTLTAVLLLMAWAQGQVQERWQSRSGMQPPLQHQEGEGDQEQQVRHTLIWMCSETLQAVLKILKRAYRAKGGWLPPVAAPLQ